MAMIENKLDRDRQIYYVYEQWLDDKCLWVGFGSNNRKNVFHGKGEKYEKLVKDRRKEIRVIVIKDGMEKKEAMNLEVIQTTKRLDEGYDLCNMVIGHSSFKGRKHSLEARKSISEKNSGKNNPMYGVPSPFKGKKHSIESRKKMSEKLKGKIPWNKGVAPTQETIDNIKKAKRNTKNHKQWVKVKVIFPNGDEKICKSITEAGEVANVKNAKYLSRTEKTCEKTGIRMERI